MLNRRQFIQASSAALATTLVSSPLYAAQPQTRKYSDAHCHLVNFLQETQGLKRLLQEADKTGVEDIIVMGLPVMKKWNVRDKRRPGYYLDNTDRCYYYSQTDIVVAREYLSLSADEQKRIHPFICGFNPTDKNCVSHVQRMLEWYPDVWEGIGELLLHRAELSMLTDGEQARANHPALYPLYEFAGKQNLPVQIHSDMGVKRFNEPIYLYEMEEAISAFPATRFIWCHAGYNRGLNIPTASAEIERLLSSYKNLWIDISWLVYENWIIQNDKPDSDWLNIFNKYTDRFFIGSDKIGDFSTYKNSIKKYDLLFDHLPTDKAQMIAQSNMINFLK